MEPEGGIEPPRAGYRPAFRATGTSGVYGKGPEKGRIRTRIAADDAGILPLNDLFRMPRFLHLAWRGGRESNPALRVQGPASGR